MFRVTACTAFLIVLIAPALALSQSAPDPAMVEKGRYIEAAGHCQGCHTAQGGQPFAGGRALVTPKGTFYSANITPDQATGIGRWDANRFHRALDRGLGSHGRLYPAMPYNYFTQVTREDSDALYAYLRTVPAVANTAPKAQVGFPLNIRALLGFWNLLYLDRGPYEPNPGKSAEWNRGAYLVTGLGHCGACHTPMNSLGAPIKDRAFQGGPVEDWFAPNLTADRRIGLGAWSKDDIAQYLRTGRNEHAFAAGPMAEVVAESTSRLSAEDVRAIAAYLSEIPASPAPAPAPAPDRQTLGRGETIYVANCARCHALDGTGQPGFYPPLRGNPAVQQGDPTNPLHILLAGARGPTMASGAPAAMPAFARLSDEDIAAVATYVRNAWGNQAPAATGAQAGALRARLAAP